MEKHSFKKLEMFSGFLFNVIAAQQNQPNLFFTSIPRPNVFVQGWCASNHYSISKPRTTPIKLGLIDWMDFCIFKC